MASPNLTKGSIARFLNGNTEQTPIVKVLGVRLCESSDGERYRLSITDDQDTFNACILSTNLNKLVTDKRLRENSLVKLNKVVQNLTSSGKPFLAILDLIVLSDSLLSKSTICPIEMITPYLNGMWKICARCFAKSPIRPHPVCDFDFVDNTGEIRAVAFRDECNRFHPMIEINKVYEISNVRVKIADKRWNKLRHTYELTLTPSSNIRLIDDPTIDANIQNLSFDFVSLENVSNCSPESLIDVIGIVDTCSSLIPFTNKVSNKDSVRRDVTIIDENSTISITLWNEQAENFDEDLAENKTVVAFQRIRIAIFNNKFSLSGHKNMTIKINPDVQQAKHLRIWYDAGGSLSNNHMKTTMNRRITEDQWKTIEQIKNEKLGQNNRSDFVAIKALVTHISNDRVVYQSCSNADCLKKVNQLSSGLFRCENCRKDSKEYRWTYQLRAELVDSTGAIWVSFFGQKAEQLMGNVSPQQFAQAKQNNDEFLMQNYLNKNCFREKSFRLCLKTETFNDVTTVKISCISISDIDFSDYGRRLISNINNNEF